MRKNLLLLFLAIGSFFTAQSQDFSNKGKDFWVAYGYHAIMVNGGNAQTMFLYFATDQPTTITVTIPGLSWTRTYTSGAGNNIITSDPMPKNIPDARLTAESVAPEDKGIHITSTQPIVAYAHILNQNASGATLLYPTPTLGKEYYSVNFTNNSNVGEANCWFYVIATEPGVTQVEITPSEAAGSHPAGVPFTVDLAQGQVFNVMGDFGGAKNSDLTGSKIRSLSTSTGGCKRIAVFSGSGRISIVCAGPPISSDNYMVQALPKTAWGKNYLTVPTAGYGNLGTALPFAFNIYRVCVLDPSTQVFIDGVLTTLPLQNGFFYEIPFSNTTHTITADKEIMVAQYLTSAGSCNNPNGDGDPEVIYLSPVEQSINTVTWNACRQFAINARKHYINIVIPNKGTAISSFKLDGTTVAASSFTVHPQNSNYSFAVLNVPSSTTGSGLSHTVTSDSGFNAIAYGYGNVESYGYNAGTNVKDLNQHLEVASQYGIETEPNVCTGSPFQFKVYFRDSTNTAVPTPIRYDSIRWDCSNTSVMSPNNFPLVIYGTGPSNTVNPDSSNTRNGSPVAWYSLPANYSFNTPGIYDITITLYRTSSEGCGNEQSYTFQLTVTAPPTASFSVTPGSCYAEPYTFAETTPQTPKATYKFWWDFGDIASGANNTSNLRNPIHIFSAPSPPGGYKVRFSDITTPGCLSDTIEQFVIVPDLPNASIASNTTACINTGDVPVTFTGTGGTAPYTFYYHINSGPALSADSPAPGGTNATVLAPTIVAGTFVYTLDSVRNFGSTACVRTITGQQITVIVTPDATFALSPTSTDPANPTLCVNSRSVNIVYDLGGSATGATPGPTNVFPPGVNGTVVGNTYVISGTPTAAGTYTYTINSEGPCLKPSVTGTITVTDDGAIALSSAVGTDDQTVCINKPLPLDIIYRTSGSSTGIGTITGLPAGVTWSYNAATHELTITGTPTTATGSPFTYTVTTLGPCINPQINGRITVSPDGFATLNTPATTADQTVCVNSSIALIRYGWGGSANTATATNLPPGVSFAIVGGQLEITGTPTAPGIFDYSVTPVGPCDNPSIGGRITVKDLPTATSVASATEVCLNTPVTITFTGSGGIEPYIFTYTFDNGTGPVTQTANSGVTNTVSVNVPTATASTYTYTLQSVQESSTGNNCLNPAIGTAVIVKVNPLPNATIAGGITVCKDAPEPQLTFTGSGGLAPYTFTYTINGIAQTPVTSDATGILMLNVPTNVANTFDYVITLVTDATATACSRAVSAKATVIVKDLPTATSATTATEVCLNAPQPVITFTGSTGTPAYVFTYIFDDGVNPPTTLTANSGAGNTATVNVPTNTAGLFTYTLQSVQESSANGCVNPAPGVAPISVRVNPLPTATISASSIATCRNTASPVITFTGAAGTAPYTFTYTINGVTQPTVSSISPSSTVTVNVNTVVAGTFKYKLVSVSDGTPTACLQTQTDEVDVTINELPTPSFTISAPNCESQTITFTSTSTAGSGTLNNADLIWNFGDPAAPTPGTGAVVTHSYATAGNYTVTLNATNSNGCLNTTPATQTFAVHANPMAGFMVPEACIADIAVFTDTSKTTDPIIDYTWDYGDPASGPNNTSSGATPNGSHQFAIPNIYTVALTITTNKGCKSVFSHPITISDANPLSLYTIVNLGSLCSSDTVSLTNKSTIAFGNITKLEIWWDNIGAPTTIVTEDNPVFDQVFKHKYPSLQVDKNYEVRMRAYSGTLCFKDLTSIITVHATPKVKFDPLPDACWDEAPYVLTQGSETGGVPGNAVYTGPGITGTNTFNPNTLTPGVTYTIKYTWTNPATGCFDTLSRDILVRDTATADLSFNYGTCDKQPVTFKDESTAPAGINLATVTWNFGDGSPLETHRAGATVQHVYPAAGPYDVTVYNTTDYGCKSTSKQKRVIVNPVPVPSFTVNETSVCLPNAAVSFTNNSTGASGMTYSWDFGDGSIGSTSPSPSHTYTDIGPWNVILTVRSDSGCIKATLPTLIDFIHPQPIAKYTTNKPTLCIGDEVIFTDITDQLDGTVVSRNWDMGDGHIDNRASFTYTYGSADSFYVKFYTVNSHGCKSTVTDSLFAVYNLPIVDAGPDKIVLEGGSVQLEPTVSGQDLKYLWTPGIYLSNNRIKNPMVSLIKEDVPYTLTVTGIGNCPVSDQVVVKVLRFPVIPNTITPNQDGINDKWVIQYLNTYPDCKVEVFTRTGQVVFRSTGYAKAWDGTKDGKPLPIDTYYYIIEPGSGREPIKGYVTILK